jgi:hypothetical protein
MFGPLHERTLARADFCYEACGTDRPFGLKPVDSRYAREM